MRATFLADVVLPERGDDEHVDVFIEGREIVSIAPAGKLTAAKSALRVEGHGHWCLPGFIDDHVHLREPGLAHKEGYAAGTLAAAAGGVTTILEIQNNPPLMIDRQAVVDKLALVRPKALVNVAVYGSLVPAAAGQLSDMSDLVAGYKLFMGPSTGGLDVTGVDRLRRLFREVATTGHWLFVHAEDGPSIAAGVKRYAKEGAASWHLARSTAAEVLATEQAIALGAELGTRVHVFHMSTAGATDLVEQARSDGQAVSSGTCFHYLYFTHEDTARQGTLLKVNPSIKSALDRDRLVEGLRSGAIDCLSSDHAPHTAEEKARPFSQAPSGIPCLDIFMPLSLTLVERGLLSLDQVIERAARTPARLHGFATKGSVAEGMDADLVLVDPQERRVVRGAEHHSRAKQTPYEGLELWGWPRATMVMGQLVHER